MKLITIDGTRGGVIFKHNEITCLNINALIKKESDIDNISVFRFLKAYSKINLCNLASLCCKLNIAYHSDDCISLISSIINQIKAVNTDIRLIQDNILNNLEYDLRPFDKLYFYSSEEDTLYLHKLLKEDLRFIGFTDSQICNVLCNNKYLTKYIPADLSCSRVITTNETLQTYDRIKEMLY